MSPGPGLDDFANDDVDHGLMCVAVTNPDRSCVAGCIASQFHVFQSEVRPAMLLDDGTTTFVLHSLGSDPGASAVTSVLLCKALMQ